MRQTRWLGRGLFVLGLLLGTSAWGQVTMRVEASARQPDGKIVVAGQVPGGSLPLKLTIGRFNADGSLDSTFSGGWVTAVDLYAANEFRATAVAVAPDGHIVV